MCCWLCAPTTKVRAASWRSSRCCGGGLAGAVDGRRRCSPGLGIFGAALFFGDSMITPAISVLSAVEGLKVVNPSLENLIIPVTVVIIVVLLAVQRRRTAAVGRVFGPVMIVWFLVIGGLGIAGIAHHPDILSFDPRMN
jgi:KUP system potassium uptake protein